MTQRRIQKHLGATAIMLVGAAGMLALLLGMNSLVPPPAPPPTPKPTAFVVPIKSKPPPTHRRKPKPKPRRTRVSNGLKPNLLSSIAGPSFGVPSLEASDTLSGTGGSKTGTMVMTEDAVDVAPTPMRQSPPDYPARARARGLTGEVVLNVLISVNGEVERVQVLEASPEGIFDASAVSSVKSWTFAPATYKGEPVRSWWRYVVRYDLT